MNLFTWGENQIRKFNIWDIAAFKIYLFFLGAIIGAYLSQFIIDYVFYIGTIAFISLAWILYRIFR